MWQGLFSDAGFSDEFPEDCWGQCPAEATLELLGNSTPSMRHAALKVVNHICAAGRPTRFQPRLPTCCRPSLKHPNQDRKPEQNMVADAWPPPFSCVKGCWVQCSWPHALALVLCCGGNGVGASLCICSFLGASGAWRRRSLTRKWGIGGVMLFRW